MLKILPNAVFPITRSAINPLMDNVSNLNTLDAGLTDNMQRAMGIMLHTHDLWVKSKGKFDYRGPAGHERLKQDTETFICGCPIASRNGDLAAAHLSIDFHDTCVRLKETDRPPLTGEVNALLVMCRDLYGLSPHEEKRIGLFLDFLSKKQVN